MSKGIQFDEYPVKKHRALYRVFKKKHRANGFNFEGNGWGRFNPLRKGGKVIPTLYIAFDDRIAMLETILRRDSSSKKPELTWLPSMDKEKPRGERTHLGQVESQRDLRLLDMESVRDGNGVNPYLELLRGDQSIYAGSQRRAIYLHAKYPYIDGLTWFSYQSKLPGERCIVLFGDRVLPDTLSFSLDEPMGTIENQARLRDALATVGAKILNDFLRKTDK